MDATREERNKRGKYESYSPHLRDEIADLALSKGSGFAAAEFSSRLGHAVTDSTVRNFVLAFRKAGFDEQSVDVIGKFAFQFGHEKCQQRFNVDAESVRRLRRIFLARYLDEDLDASDSPQTVYGRDCRVFDDALKANIARHAQYAGIEDAVNVFSQRLNFPLKESTVTAFLTEHQQRPTTAHHQVIFNAALPGVAIGSASVTIVQQQPLTTSTNAPSTSTSVSLMLQKEPTEKKPGRGRYTTYNAEMGAKIGRMAVEAGNQAAVRHFNVPESTVRRLRDKFLLKERQASKRRGRPMLLGKYDEVVRRCLDDLAASGEKISYFLAIATAKQVINQKEPNLLKENGGKLNLDVAWAKSFLSRINKSQQ